MSEPQKKAGVGFWITVALVAVLVGYPLSFGPACWLVRKAILPTKPVAIVYQPLVKRASVRRIERGWPGIVLEKYSDAFAGDNDRGIVYALAVELMPQTDLRCGFSDPAE